MLDRLVSNSRPWVIRLRQPPKVLGLEVPCLFIYQICDIYCIEGIAYLFNPHYNLVM